MDTLWKQKISYHIMPSSSHTILCTGSTNHLRNVPCPAIFNMSQIRISLAVLLLRTAISMPRPINVKLLKLLSGDLKKSCWLPVGLDSSQPLEWFYNFLHFFTYFHNQWASLRIIVGQLKDPRSTGHLWQMQALLDSKVTLCTPF